MPAASFVIVADRLESNIDQLPEATQKQWRREQARALREQGDITRALVLLRAQAERFPNDSQVQMELARLLVDASAQDSSLIDAALNQWRRIAQRSPKNSDNWFAAKYHVASLLSRQGKTEDALQLLRYLRAVPPGWSNSSMQAQFDELYRSLGGQ